MYVCACMKWVMKVKEAKEVWKDRDVWYLSLPAPTKIDIFFLHAELEHKNIRIGCLSFCACCKRQLSALSPFSHYFCSDFTEPHEITIQTIKLGLWPAVPAYSDLNTLNFE